MTWTVQKTQQLVVMVTILVMSGPRSVFCGSSLENKVDQIEAKQAIMEQRTNAITNSIMSELSSLQKDSNGIKSAVGRLVEDNVNFQNKLDGLKGVGEEITTLRRKVTDVKKTLAENVNVVQGQVTRVSHSMEQGKQEQANKLNQMNLQLNENKVVIGNLQGQLGGQSQQLDVLNKKVTDLADGGSPASLQAVQDTINKVTSRLGSLQQKYDLEVSALRNEVDGFRRKLETANYYPSN